MNILPIDAPSRVESWRRLQLALAVLDQRPATPETVAVAMAALRGIPIEDLVQQQLAGGRAA